MTTVRIAVALCLMLGLAALTGCQGSMSMGNSSEMPKTAVVISGGQSGGTVVFLPTSDPEKPMMLSTAGVDMCPDCKAAAIKYFQTGVLEPKCAKCGATRTLTTAISTNVGHQ